jgi:tetratricopeptide (TPR) repeat protein
MTLAAWLIQSDPNAGRDDSVRRQWEERLRLHHHELLTLAHAAVEGGDRELGLKMTQLAMNMTATRRGAIQLGEEYQIKGRYEEATHQFRRAIHEFPDPSDPTPQYLLAIAEASLGKLEDAAKSLAAYMHVNSRHPMGWYFLASLYASLERFADAQAIFSAAHPVPLDEGKFTNTRVVSFHPDRPPADEALHGRVVTWDRARAAKRLADAELVQFVACDSRYFLLFAESVLRSGVRNAGLRIGTHFHVINPDAEAQSLMERLDASDRAVVFSTESVKLDALSIDERKTYYSCSRFFLLPEVLDVYGKTTLVTDADQLIVQSLKPTLKTLEAKDVGLLLFPTARFNILSLISASVFFAAPTAGGRAFAGAVRDYLLGMAASQENLSWHLDQAALAVAYLSGPKVDVELLPPAIMESKPAAMSSNAAAPEAVFWSVTYSQSQNAAKLDGEIFQQYT